MGPMTSVKTRGFAAAGVLVAALATLAVLRPALQELGYGQFSWLAVGCAAIPLGVLFVSGYGWYGPLRAAVVATAVTAVAATAAVALFVLVLGLSLSGSRNAPTALAVLWAAPPVLVLVLGGLALRFVRPRAVRV